MALQYDHILFDLDGTLTDSSEGITKSLQYALSRHGIEEPDLLKLKQFIGPPLVTWIQKLYPADDALAAQIVQTYREHYGKTGVYQNAPYPGIPELLETLQNASAGLYVASAKPQMFVDIVLRHFDLDRYFKKALGPPVNKQITEKKEMILTALAGESFSRKNTVMIGDTWFDAEGAAKAGVDFIGVLYGFGRKSEMESFGFSRFARDPEELREYLIR